MRAMMDAHPEVRWVKHQYSAHASGSGCRGCASGFGPDFFTPARDCAFAIKTDGILLVISGEFREHSKYIYLCRERV